MKTLLQIFLLITLIITFSSCVSTQRHIDKATENVAVAKVTQEVIAEKHPEVALEMAARIAPIKSEIVVEHDTIYVPKVVKGVSVPCPPVVNPATGKKEVVYVPCPDVEYLETIIQEKITETQENTAQILLLQKEKEKLGVKLLIEEERTKDLRDAVISLENDLQAEQDKPNYYKWIFWLVVVGGIILVVVKFLLPRIR